MRGGGAAGFDGAGLCTCALPCAFWRCIPCVGGADGGTLATGGAAEAETRGGTATVGGAALAAGTADGGPDGEAAVNGGVTGAFGGITTTAGGRIAATEAGVTSFGAGGSATGLGGKGLTGAAGAASLASIGGAAMTGLAAGGFAIGRVAGCSAASFCCVMARNTSPGREICDRSILVLISSSACAVAEREALAGVDPPSERERRCLRTSSASCSSRELECVFFSVTPTVVSTSRISLLLTSSSRARSLIRIFIRSRFPFPVPHDFYARIPTLAYHPHGIPLELTWRDWQSSRFRSGQWPRLAVFPKSTLLVFGSFFRRWLLCFFFSRRLLGFFGGRHFGRLGFRG